MRARSSGPGSCGGSFLLPLHKLFAYLCFPQCTALSCPDFPPNFLSDRTARRGAKVKKTPFPRNRDTPFWKMILRWGNYPFSRTVFRINDTLFGKLPFFPDGTSGKCYSVRETTLFPGRNFGEMILRSGNCPFSRMGLRENVTPFGKLPFFPDGT